MFLIFLLFVPFFSYMAITLKFMMQFCFFLFSLFFNAKMLKTLKLSSVFTLLI